MELDTLKAALDKKKNAEINMAQTVLAQVNHYREDLKELSQYCLDLVDIKGNPIAIDTYSFSNCIGLFKTHKLDWKGETDGIVYLDMDKGSIKIDVRDTSHDAEFAELDVPKLNPSPVELSVDLLACCIAENNNFEMAMQATNPNYLIKFVTDNANKEVEDIENRINTFNR